MDNIDRILSLAKLQGVSQTHLCNLLGKSKHHLQNVKRGLSSLSEADLEVLATALHTTTDYLTYKSDVLGSFAVSESNILDDRYLIPVYGVIACGEPVLATQNILNYIPVSRQMVSTGKYFALVCHGDSMQPKIFDGDTVVIKAQSDVEDGQIAAILVNGEDATLKKIVHTDSGILVIPFNTSKYQPQLYPASAVTILGRAVEVRAEL